MDQVVSTFGVEDDSMVDYGLRTVQFHLIVNCTTKVSLIFIVLNMCVLYYTPKHWYLIDFLLSRWKKYLLNLCSPFSCLHFNTRHIICNLTGITTVSTHWYSFFLPALPNKEEPFSTQKPTWSLKNRNYIPLEPFGRFPLHAEENLVS